MCFSATASFSAAGVLASIGVWSVRSAPSRRHVALAAIPLLFAIQQLCEGAVWMALARAPYHVGATNLARGFLLFALFVWPLYVAMSLALVERDHVRRISLAAMAIAGAALGAYLMTCATFRASNACIAFGNLYYWVQVDAPMKPIAPFVYITIIAAPLVVSSLRGTTWLALATIASFASAGWLTRAGFISVWCFFAALLSGIVVLVVGRCKAQSPLSCA